MPDQQGSLHGGSGRDRRRFGVATEQEIRGGLVTDVYFERTEAAVAARGADKTVVGEMRVSRLPLGWDWGILAGIEEVARLLEGLGIHVWALPEGSVFCPGDPVLTIAGPYSIFGRFETAFLGLTCQATGVATRTARCRLAAGERTLLSFGARRMHPALAPMIERAAYLGGCDGVSTVLAANLLHIPPSGTMPHALVLLLGDTLEAAWAYDETAPPEIARIVLIDTLQDEKFETLRVAEAMGERLYGVRFDTPSSRRGSLLAIMQEVRWELDLRGYQHVKLFASGGLDEHSILELNAVCDGYGVGTALSNAPTVNFAFDLVEIAGVPLAKRGKESGGKFIAHCPLCGNRQIIPWKEAPGLCSCGGERERLNRLLIDDGEIVADLPSIQELRAFVLRQLAGMEASA